MSRSGAALILALILLAALLLLGLPFLYSQASSLSGTRSFADGRQAQIGRDSAENLAAAVAAYAMSDALVATTPTDRSSAASDLCSLAVDSDSAITGPALDRIKPAVIRLDEGLNQNAGDDDGSIGLQPQGLGLGFNDEPGSFVTRQRTFIGALITDESGKLDPNDMPPHLWGALLDAVGIQDWDDDNLYPGGPAPTFYQADKDKLGQLAQTLAGVRFAQPSRRITNLEQLLSADPQRSQKSPSMPWLKLRHALTRAELERLRPYLTLHNPRQGRDGLVDLGTVSRLVALTDAGGTLHTTLFMDGAPDAHEPLLALGTLLTGEDLVTTGSVKAHQIAMINSNTDTGSPLLIQGKTFFAPGGETLATQGSAVAIEAPAPLNVHQLAPLMRTALGFGTQLPKPLTAGPPPIIDTEIRTIAALGAFPPAASITLFDRARPFLDSAATPSPYLDLGGDLEMPPLGILSAGVFSIDSAATVTDVLGRQTAQAARRDIVQAVPQEYLLERRWLTQGAMHALLAQRYGSHMQAWPVAYERRTIDAASKRVMPDDHDLRAETASAIATGTSFRSRTQPDLGTVPQIPVPGHVTDLHLQHVRLDWRAAFGGEKPAADADLFRPEIWNGSAWVAGSPPLPKPTAGLADPIKPEDLRPDGFHHKDTVALAYSLGSDPKAMFIERAGATDHELGARHVSFWVKPEADWGTGFSVAGGPPASDAQMIPLLDARMPTNPSSATDQYTEPGTATTRPGSNDSQNYLGLWYDAKHEMLVLALAPPSVEHTFDAGPHIRLDDHATQTLDERSLGGAPADPWLAPADCPNPTTIHDDFCGAFAPNRVLHCYKTPAAAGQPFFRAGQWHHIQVAIASDRPDGVSIIVDGIVGKDAFRANPAGPTLAALGDHATVPALVLTQFIDSASPVSDASGLGPLTINVAAVAPIKVLDLLPAHGMVRIDDEYFTYDSISGAGSTATLTNCYRGQRQNTYATSPADATVRYPNTQRHLAGALVTPGGYRVVFQAGAGVRNIYRGGCALKDQVTTGLAAPANPDGNSFTTWSRLKKPQAILIPAAPNYLFPASSGIPAGVDQIDLDPTFGNPGSFPINGGIVVVRYPGRPDCYLHYTTASGNSLSGLSAIDTWPSSLAGPLAWPGFSFPQSGAPAPMVLLISIHVGGPDPLQTGRYTKTILLDPFGNPLNSFMLQLLDPADGRIEWLGYDAILTDTSTGDGGFFLGFSGFHFNPGAGGARGLCRTDFPTKPEATAASTNPFPIGTRVIPVQTEAGNGGHWIATGDVITLMPHAPAVAKRPLQAVVRYASMDGYKSSSAPYVDATMGMFIDSRNEFFAFTTELPDIDPLFADYDFLCGNCWSGEDLTPMRDPVKHVTERSQQPRGNLPRLDLWGADFQVGNANGPRVHIGNVDADRASLPNVACDATIDGLCAGPLAPGTTLPTPVPETHESAASAGVPANATQNGIAWFIKGTTITPTLLDTDDVTTTAVIAQAALPIFDFELGAMGLVEIDGEVFAYQQITDDSMATDVVTAENAQRAVAGYDGLPAVDATIVKTSGRFARLVARGLLDLDAKHYTHSVGALTDGPFIDDSTTPTAKLLPSMPILPAMRLPIGPVLQIDPATAANVDSPTAWFRLTDGTTDASGKPNPRYLEAPAALFCTGDGDPTTMEMLQLVGPRHHPYAPSPADAFIDCYATSDWLRGLYGTTKRSWANGGVVIGWWPRYASALPPSGATKETFRSRAYAWLGLPFSLSGSYFDPNRLASLPAPYAGMSLAEVAVDPASLFPSGAAGTAYFEVEARALALEDQWSGAPPIGGGAMDWSKQTGVPAASAGAAFAAANDQARCFSDGVKTARPVDGAELRITWRYQNIPAYDASKPETATLGVMADATNRCPVIASARLRCLAPVRVLATEHAR